jgi:hypothetical protein
MNILMLNYEYPPLGGGAGQVTLNISERLAIHNNVYVVTSGFRGLPATEKKRNGVQSFGNAFMDAKMLKVL